MRVTSEVRGGHSVISQRRFSLLRTYLYGSAVPCHATSLCFEPAQPKVAYFCSVTFVKQDVRALVRRSEREEENADGTGNRIDAVS